LGGGVLEWTLLIGRIGKFKMYKEQRECVFR